MTEQRFNVGKRVGRLTLLQVLGTERAHGRLDWVYRWQCDCGNIERIPQRNMDKGRVDCLTCSRIRNRNAAAKTAAPIVKLPTQTPEGIPNPALLPVPSSIKTGPERWARVRYR